MAKFLLSPNKFAAGYVGLATNTGLHVSRLYAGFLTGNILEKGYRTRRNNLRVSSQVWNIIWNTWRPATGCAG